MGTVHYLSRRMGGRIDSLQQQVQTQIPFGNDKEEGMTKKDKQLEE
jgi:hypothetical protein